MVEEYPEHGGSTFLQDDLPEYTDVTFQKIIFIVTAVRTSDRTRLS
jgi:hypothetical protein